MPHIRSVAFCLFLECFFLMSLLFAIVSLLTWKEFTVDDKEILQQGVFSTKRLALNEIREVDWQWRSRKGAVKLISGSQSIYVSFHNYQYKTDDKLWIIRFLRTQLRHATHNDWELFCLKVAMPLLLPSDERLNKDLEPDQEELTVWHYDRIFLIGIFGSVIVGAISIWLANDWSVLASAPTILGGIWIVCRWRFLRSLNRHNNLKQDLRVTRLHPDDRRYWIQYGLAPLFLLAAWGYVEYKNLPDFQGTLVAIAAGVPAMFFAIRSLVQMDKNLARRRRQFWAEKAANAAAKWEKESLEFQEGVPDGIKK